MFIAKNDILSKINEKEASEKIGTDETALINILNGKNKCSKIVAYCITKYINENAEITDYFDRIEE